MKSDVKDSRNIKILSFLCIIHQENLCKMSLLNFDHVMTVAKIVDFIPSKGLNHRQFQHFHNHMETENADIIYDIEIGSWSAEKCFNGFSSRGMKFSNSWNPKANPFASSKI